MYFPPCEMRTAFVWEIAFPPLAKSVGNQLSARFVLWQLSPSSFPTPVNLHSIPQQLHPTAEGSFQYLYSFLWEDAARLLPRNNKQRGENKKKKDGSIRKKETRVLPPPLSPLGGDLKSLPHKVMRQESSSLPPLPLLRGQRETKYPKIRPYPSSSFSLPFSPRGHNCFFPGAVKSSH